MNVTVIFRSAAFFVLAVCCSAQFVSAQVNTTLEQSDLVSIGPLGWIAPNLEMPVVDATVPIVGPNDKTPGAVLLRRKVAQGKAGGFEGMLYENRDRGHSKLSADQFPALTHLLYAPELRDQNLDYGLAGRIVLPAIVLGNSSTAMKQGIFARSQTRLAMTSPGGPERAFLTYSNNHIYVYPEHRDHDAADLFPANWPYMVTSQGSSGSDLPFLHAFALTLAALPEDTREFLREQHLVAPTLQMILRRTLSNVRNRETYLSAAAHPSSFYFKRLAPERMVALAAALTPKNVPPMVRLSVEDEDFSDAAGLAGLSERLFDTPSAIARVWRSLEFRREITVSALDTKDPNGRALQFEWVLLRGDPDKVRITPLDSTGKGARIRVDWHDPMNIARKGTVISNRVDIGVFANNGAHDSAPAFISISFPSHEKRVYSEVSGSGDMLLASIDYSAGQGQLYYDPSLHWSAQWRDEFEYDAQGQIVRWQRVMGDQTLVLRSPEQTSQSAVPVHKLENQENGPVLLMQ